MAIPVASCHSCLRFLRNPEWASNALKMSAVNETGRKDTAGGQDGWGEVTLRELRQHQTALFVALGEQKKKNLQERETEELEDWL